MRAMPNIVTLTRTSYVHLQFSSKCKLVPYLSNHTALCSLALAISCVPALSYTVQLTYHRLRLRRARAPQFVLSTNEWRASLLTPPRGHSHTVPCLPLRGSYTKMVYAISMNNQVTNVAPLSYFLPLLIRTSKPHHFPFLLSASSFTHQPSPQSSHSINLPSIFHNDPLPFQKPVLFSHLIMS